MIANASVVKSSIDNFRFHFSFKYFRPYFCFQTFLFIPRGIQKAKIQSLLLEKQFLLFWSADLNLKTFLSMTVAMKENLRLLLQLCFCFQKHVIGLDIVSNLFKQDMSSLRSF